jgi:hypothetical protein
LTLVADAHVHVYPAHDVAAALQSAVRNLSRLAAAAGAGDAARAVFLTERSDCHLFADLASGRVRPADWSVRPTPEATALLLERAGPALYVIAGRQLVTRECLEVLALGLLEAPAQGRAAAEVVEAVARAGGLPVIPWSPGKWLFGRGRVLESLVRTALPGQLLLADSSLRARGIPEPRLFARARRRGLHLVAGTDPLPLPGEEQIVGSFGVVCPGAFDAERPATSALRLLADAPVRVGRRRSPAGVAVRLARLALARRSR